MTLSPDSPLEISPVSRWARWGGIFTIAVGLLVLIGWQFHIQSLKSMWADLPAMNPTTAITFLLTGSSLLLIRSGWTNRQRAGECLAALTALIAFVKIGFFIDWWTFDIDKWLYRDEVLRENWHGIPNQMASFTASCFVLQSFALLLFRKWRGQGSLISQTLLSVQVLIALAGFLSYFYGARSAIEFGIFLPMAMPTAITFLVLAPATLGLMPQYGVMPVLCDSGQAGVITRRFLISGALVPLLIGRLTLAGLHAGYYQAILGVTVFCVASTFCFLALILWYGSTLFQWQGEHQRQQSEIRDSEERLKRLSDSAFEGIVISQYGLIVDANREFCRMFGYDLDELIGMRILDLVSPQSRAMVAKQIGENIEHLYETVGLQRNGTEFDLEVYARMIRLHGESARVTALRDITQRRIVDRMKDEFVSVVNHELRTPLTSIHGALGLVSGGVVCEVPTALVPLIDIASRNVQRLLTLVNGLLDLQKMELGHMEFNLTEINLSELIGVALENNAPLGGPANVDLTHPPFPEVVLVYSDAERLMQVLTNLLSNAVKYSPPGGTVRVVLKSDGKTARVEVLDTGEGIPTQFYDRIFRKFAQADSSSTRQKGGTGLGLSISKSIIEKLGGTIGFQAGAEKGTIFFFELPQMSASTENSAEPQPTETASLATVPE